MKCRSMILMVGLIVLALLAMAAPAFAAPSPFPAAFFGLHNAHCKTMGTPGHAKTLQLPDAARGVHGQLYVGVARGFFP